jgi:glycosyltransferase involved in cell wall biosynthesis
MISVIIPCYNYGNWLQSCIQSLQQQTYNNIEIIVINDGSTDNTVEIVNALAENDSRIKCFTFENGGLGSARNHGLKFANGDYIQFLDADDLIEKKKFEVQISAFENNNIVDIVYGPVRYFTKNPYDVRDRKYSYWGINSDWMPKYTGYGHAFASKAFKGNFTHLSSPLFKKSFVDKIGLFDNDISAVADYHFLLRCVVADGFFHYDATPETYSLVRWHPNNMSKNSFFMRQEELRMRKKLAFQLETNTVFHQFNNDSIKSLTIQLSSSWKTIFLSGGPLDPLKNYLSRFGLEKIAKRIFYK